MGGRTGAITFGGLSSGLPTAELIEQLVELERRPIDLLEDRKSGFEEQLGILQDLNSKALALRDSLRAIDNMDLLGSGPSAFEEFSQFAATPTDSTIATAIAGSGAVSGSLEVEVTALAAQSRHVSAAGYATETEAVVDSSAGQSISIEVGASQGTGTTTVVDIAADASLEDIVSAINNSDADVQASILNDGSATPYKLVIQGKSTGEDNDVFLDLSGLSGFATTMNETQDAGDATMLLDPDGGSPVTLTSATNTFSDVVSGVSVTARKVDATAVRIEIEQDDDSIVDLISDIVTQYNDIVSIIDEQANIDPTTNRGGPLLGDSTLSGLRRQLGTVIASQIGSGSLQSASELGLDSDRDGTLTLDETDLRAKLASDPTGVAEFFSGSGSLTDQLRSVTDTYTDIVDGLLVARINGTSSSIDDISDSILKAEDRLETVESDLVRRFAALERNVSGIQAQGNFITQFLTNGLS